MTVTWIERTSSFGTTDVNDVANDGLGTWVAVGDDGKLATSTDDGETWTQQVSSFGTTSINSVAHNQTDLWVAVGGGKLAASADGVAWQQHPTPHTVTKVEYGNIWVAIGGNAFNPAIQTSPDGITWTSQSSGFMDTICVGFNGTDLWLVIGDVGTNRVESSPDGITWTYVTDLTLTGSTRSIHHDKTNTWICGADNNQISKSNDGAFWTPINIDHNIIYDVSHNAGKWMIVGDDGAESSEDGITWIVESIALTNINGVAGDGANTFVVVGNGGKLTTGVVSSPADTISARDIGATKKSLFLNRIRTN